MNVHGGFIARLNCADIATQLDQEGYAVLRGLLNDSQVRELAALRGVASADDRVSPASEQPGRGDLFYFLRPLPAPLEELRTAFYGCLAPIANRWRVALDIPHRYPDTLDAFLMQNRKAGQVRAQSNLTHLLADGYQVLHQHSDGEQVFPLQLVALLSEPEKDFTGGEFVMTEQRPRMQSRPMVLPLRRGDVAVIAAAGDRSRAARATTVSISSMRSVACAAASALDWSSCSTTPSDVDRDKLDVFAQA